MKKLFSKFKGIKNKGVVIFLALQMLLCVSAVAVAVTIALKEPSGAPPEDAEIGGDDDITLPENLSFCYVTFDTDGASSVAKQRVWKGDVPIEPKEPKKSGYYFVSWTLNGEVYDFKTPINGATTLKAQWHPLLNCTFEYDDGTESVTTLCRAGDKIEAPKRAPSREGAYFVGWSVGDELWDFDSPVSGDMTLRPTYSTTAEISLSLDSSPYFDSAVTLGSASFSVGDLKPVWGALAERFDAVFTHHESDGEGNADFIFGNLDELIELGTDGGTSLLNLRDYLDRMPNLRAYLEANPTVYLSILSTDYGKPIYAVPLSELYSYPTTLPIFNSDIVVALLDGDGEFESVDTERIISPKYFGVMPKEGAISVPIYNDGELGYFEKRVNRKGNIIERMNYLIDTPSVRYIDGASAVRELRAYIDEVYGDTLENRSDLFLGVGAMYDTDELVALMRCVMLNRETLGLSSGGASICVDSYDELLILCEMLFGARGISDSSSHLYFDEDGTLYDARVNVASYEAASLMRSLILEGLVCVTTDNGAKENSLISIARLPFESDIPDGFSIALPPLAYYEDLGKFTRFLPYTTSYSDAAISVSDEVKADSVKLSAVLSIIDYLYSDEGRALIMLGGGDFADGTAASALAHELTASLSGGEYPAFLEDLLGAIFTDSAYIAYGEGHSLSVATLAEYISLGIIDSYNNLWDDDYLYSFVPDRLPLTEYNKEKLLEIAGGFGEFSFDEEENIFVQILRGEAEDYGVAYDEHFRLNLDGSEYLKILRQVVGRLKAYYNSYL